MQGLAAAVGPGRGWIGARCTTNLARVRAVPGTLPMAGVAHSGLGRRGQRRRGLSDVVGRRGAPEAAWCDRLAVGACPAECVLE